MRINFGTGRFPCHGERGLNLKEVISFCACAQKEGRAEAERSLLRVPGCELRKTGVQLCVYSGLVKDNHPLLGPSPCFLMYSMFQPITCRSQYKAT